jgi:hypothetical protein
MVIAESLSLPPNDGPLEYWRCLFAVLEGTKQTWLANKTGVSPMTISNYRKGLVKKELNYDLVLKFTELLGLSRIEREELLIAAECYRYLRIPHLSNNDSPVPVLTCPILHPAQFFGRTAETA